MQLSFSFAFFLHGESTVCMSVDVRQHPAIRRVNKTHLQTCQSPNQALPGKTHKCYFTLIHLTYNKLSLALIKVILAPHGLTGTLTGAGFRLHEQGASKILEEWKHFYPVEAALKSPLYDMSLPPQGSHSSPHPSTACTSGFQTAGSNGSNIGIPPVLEVLIGGVRMRYPAPYVLVTEPEDLPKRLENVSKSKSAGPVAPKSKHGVAVTLDSESAVCPALSPGRPQSSSTTPLEVRYQLKKKLEVKSLNYNMVFFLNY